MAESTRVQPTFDAPLVQFPPAAAPPPPAVIPAAAPAVTPQRVFAADRPGEADAGRPSPALERVAELVAHRGAEGPFTIAIVGGPGSGKSRALAQVVARASALSQGADGKASPYMPGLTVVTLDAAEFGSDPRAAIAERVHATLTRVAPDIAADAADEATHSATDPHARLRSLGDSLDASRRRLDSERRARDEAESRRARLIETILYESGGSRIDAYARANRTGIESALTSFGFTKDDPVAAYKGLVHTLTETGGPAARMASSAKSLWAYRGQGKLIVWAIIFLIAAWGLGALGRDLSWLDPVQSQGDTLRSIGDKVRVHRDWFALARLACLGGAVLCVLACILRAIRFSRPLLRGASLVDADLAVRRGELDNLVAHHTQRVDALATETDGLARRASDAERRVGGTQTVTPTHLVPNEAAAADRSRRAYLEIVADRLSRGAKGPGRLVVALDELDSLPPATALAALEAAAAAVRAESFGLVAAFDPARLIQAGGDEARARLDRLVQIPIRIDGDGDLAWDDVIGRIAAPFKPGPSVKPDPAHSTLDQPLDEREQKVLASLAPLAGPSPRGVKRFVNLYRLGREDAAEAPAAFAFALALSIGGTPTEKAAFDATLQPGDGGNAMHRDGVARLQTALEQVNALASRPISVDDARRAKKLAARWSLEG